MTKPKTLEQLRAEKERAETQIDFGLVYFMNYVMLLMGIFSIKILQMTLNEKLQQIDLLEIF